MLSFSFPEGTWRESKKREWVLKVSFDKEMYFSNVAYFEITKTMENSSGIILEMHKIK